MENQETAAIQEKKKQHDVIDYTLVGAFTVTLLLILVMCYEGRDIPSLLVQILNMSAVALGFKKALPGVKL